MVIYNPKTWVTIFQNYGKHVVRTLRPALIFMFSYSTALYLLVHWQDWHFISTLVMHQLMGIVLGLFLVFRTNTAYERWWEGRKLWGSMVNNTRNLAFKVRSFLPGDEHKDDRIWFSQMIPNLPMSLKEHLRDKHRHDQLEIKDDFIIAEISHTKHIPNELSAMMYERMAKLYKSGKISGEQMMVMDRELKEFSDIIGACERIKNTPIPFSYSMYIKKFIFVYLFTLPIGLVGEEGLITIPIVVLITYILLGVELIAEEIEDPFGKDINDLPTDGLSAKIKENVREILR
jgi:ion channel-forming bestrophin family protein